MTKLITNNANPSAARPTGDYADRIEGRDRRRVRRAVRAGKRSWLEG